MIISLCPCFVPAQFCACWLGPADMSFLTLFRPCSVFAGFVAVLSLLVFPLFVLFWSLVFPVFNVLEIFFLLNNNKKHIHCRPFEKYNCIWSNIATKFRNLRWENSIAEFQWIIFFFAKNILHTFLVLKHFWLEKLLNGREFLKCKKIQTQNSAKLLSYTYSFGLRIFEIWG